MGKIIVIQFVTLDGIVEDPDGSDGTPLGGWCYRFGGEAIAGDKFRLGDVLDTGVLLFGRRTWQLFAQRWPARSDAFSARMNAAAKRVVTRSPLDTSAWASSAVLDGDLLDAVQRLRDDRDVVVIGSTSVVRALVSADLVDEYRLLVFPTVLGAGNRLFTRPADLRLESVQQSGPTALMRYQRAQDPGGRGETALTGRATTPAAR
jgi:dihydrofolate reductase